MLIVLDSNVGYLNMLAGRVEEGLARCRSGLDRLGPDRGERWQQSYLRLLEGICLFLLGDLGASAAAFRTALAMKHEIADTMGTGYALEGTAWLAAAEQRCTRAAWLLGAADARWQLVGSRLGRNATVEALHARAEQTVRDALGAERYRTLHDQGAGYPLAEIVRLAAQDADDLPPPGRAAPPAAGRPAPAPALTSRELEIAGLVSEGLSNRQIAERLVISKRTVDAHIEHIYGKLGVSSRVQLASWLRSAPALSLGPRPGAGPPSSRAVIGGRAAGEDPGMKLCRGESVGIRHDAEETGHGDTSARAEGLAGAQAASRGDRRDSPA